MKHSRLTTGSFLGVLSPLAGFAACLAVALSARAADVPFTERVISTSADVASSLLATDLDGDGDIDMLSASANDLKKIAWYESDGGSPPKPNGTRTRPIVAWRGRIRGRVSAGRKGRENLMDVTRNQNNHGVAVGKARPKRLNFRNVKLMEKRS